MHTKDLVCIYTIDVSLLHFQIRDTPSPSLSYAESIETIDVISIFTNS